MRLFARTLGRSLFVIVLAKRLLMGYLDPGTGSFVLQILLATLLSALFAVKIFWGRIVGVFKRGKSDKVGGDAGNPPNDTPQP